MSASENVVRVVNELVNGLVNGLSTRRIASCCQRFSDYTQHRNFVADCGTPDKQIIILNGTGTERVTVRFTKETKAIAYGLDGKQIKEIAIPQGLSEIALPRGGYLISL